MLDEMVERQFFARERRELPAAAGERRGKEQVDASVGFPSGTMDRAAPPGGRRVGIA